jgi:hypothetical protein
MVRGDKNQGEEQNMCDFFAGMVAAGFVRSGVNLFYLPTRSRFYFA